MVWHDGGQWSDVPCNYHLSYTCKKGVCESVRSQHSRCWCDIRAQGGVFSLTASCGDPPDIPHAKLFGKKRLRYETDTLVRYYCEDGFVQTLRPVVRCLPGGQWEQPLITCSPSELPHQCHIRVARISHVVSE